MAQHINPTVKRLGINKNWTSRWFDLGNFPWKLAEDQLIRRELEKILEKAHYQTVEIERKGDRINVVIFTSKPGMIIKHKGEGLDDTKKSLEKSLNKFRRKNHITDKYSISINIEEVKKPFLSAQIVAFDIRDDIEKRIPYRKTIKKYLERIMSNREAKGAKIFVTGRLDGADIARSDWVKEGKLPLNTLRAIVDYGTVYTRCTYGKIGIKVWIYKGEAFKANGKKPISKNSN